MTETGLKWAFVRSCGCLYGFRYDIDGVVTTPMQAWALFYKGQPKDRAKDEAAGYSCRPWQDGDHLQWEDPDPHTVAANPVGPALY